MDYEGEERRMGEAPGRRDGDSALAVVIDGVQNGARRDLEELLMIARVLKKWVPRAVHGLFALVVLSLGWIIRQEVADRTLARMQTTSDVRASSLAEAVKALDATDRQILEALSAVKATQQELKRGIGQNWQEIGELRGEDRRMTP